MRGGELEQYPASRAAIGRPARDVGGPRESQRGAGRGSCGVYSDAIGSRRPRREELVPLFHLHPSPNPRRERRSLLAFKGRTPDPLLEISLLCSIRGFHTMLHSR